MKRLFVLYITLFVAACSNRTGIPNEIIPIESMEKIMADMILANNYATDFLQKDSTKKDKVQLNQDLMAVIFQIHHTTAGDFKKSLTFYESRPDLSRKIFDSLEAFNTRHRKDDYKPIGNSPTHPVKTPFGPNGKPIINPHAIKPFNQHGMPPFGHPPYKTPSGKPLVGHPARQAPATNK